MKIKGTKKFDILYGGAEADIIKGRKGGDELYGSDGNDILKGGRGKDRLWGGDGEDVLIGGKGRDTFFIDTKSIDTIKDFDPARDRILFNDNDIYETPPEDYLSDFSFSGGALLYQGIEIVKVDPFEPDFGNLFLA